MRGYGGIPLRGALFFFYFFLFFSGVLGNEKKKQQVYVYTEMTIKSCLFCTNRTRLKYDLDFPPLLRYNKAIWVKIDRVYGYLSSNFPVIALASLLLLLLIRHLSLPLIIINTDFVN